MQALTLNTVSFAAPAKRVGGSCRVQSRAAAETKSALKTTKSEEVRVAVASDRFHRVSLIAAVRGLDRVAPGSRSDGPRWGG